MRRDPEELLRWAAKQLLVEPVDTEQRLMAEVFRAAADAWQVYLTAEPPRNPRDRRLVYAVVGLARYFERVDNRSGAALPERDAREPWQPPPLPAREVYEREDPETGAPLPPNVVGFRPGGGAR